MDKKNFDYSTWTTPITKEEVKKMLINELKSFHKDSSDDEFILTKKMEQDVDLFVNRTMYGFRDTLNYLGENNKEDILDILEGVYK